jgi:hypothetical protein
MESLTHTMNQSDSLTLKPLKLNMQNKDQENPKIILTHQKDLSIKIVTFVVMFH